MKYKCKVEGILYFMLIINILFLSGCSKGAGSGDLGAIIYNGEIVDFLEVGLNAPSPLQSVMIKGFGMTKEIKISVDGDFEIALNNNGFSKKYCFSVCRLFISRNSIQRTK